VIERPVFEPSKELSVPEPDERKPQDGVVDSPVHSPAQTPPQPPKPKAQSTVSPVVAKRIGAQPNVQEVMKRLRVEAIHDDDLLSVAREHEWVDPGVRFVANIGEAKATVLLDNWSIVMAKIRERAHLATSEPPAKKKEVFSERDPFL
jgi:hypothetical protein